MLASSTYHGTRANDAGAWIRQDTTNSPECWEMESLESNPIIRGEHSENDNNDSMPSNSGDNNGLWHPGVFRQVPLLGIISLFGPAMYRRILCDSFLVWRSTYQFLECAAIYPTSPVLRSCKHPLGICHLSWYLKLWLKQRMIHIIASLHM